jgi:hypothetical protein
MGLTCRCTECTASARPGVRRDAMCRLGLRDSHACTPLFEFLGEGDKGITSSRPVAPSSAARRISRGWRASVRFPKFHGLQGKVAHGWACGSVRRPAADMRVVELTHPGTAISEPAAAPHGSDAGRTRGPDGAPHAAQPPAVSGPLLPAAAADEAAHEEAGETTNYKIMEKQEMKFEDLRYVERTNKYGQTPCLIMPGGFPVFKSTMELAWASVHQNWANIDWSVKQPSKTMIGEEHWGEPEEKGFNQALGRAIRFFVKHDMLPLPLALAMTRRGKPYRGGRRLYVLAHSTSADVLPVTAISAIRTARNSALLTHVDWSMLGKTTPSITTGEPS